MVKNYPFLYNYCFVILFGFFLGLNKMCGQTFERVESAAGLGALEKNNGIAVADYDGDNDLDLFIVAKAKDEVGIVSSHSKLYRNNNDGTFTDVTQESGLIDLFPVSEVAEAFAGLSGYKNGAYWGDYDNDGFPDLFLTNTSKVQLFHNEGNGAFIEVTEQSGLQKYNGCLNTGATWFDYNKDGLLDLYINVWSTSCENKFYENKGNGTFADVSSIFQGSSNKLSYHSIPFDFNNDGWMDLYVANDSQLQPNDLFINNNGLGFSEQSSIYGLNHSKDDMGIAIADFNRDGLFDFFITTINENALMANSGNNTYLDLAAGTNLQAAGWAWDVSFSDFDLDGDEDLYIVNGFSGTSYNDNNRYFESLYANGDKKFVDASSKSKLGERTISFSQAVFDYDNDGDLDILVSNNDRASYFYENQVTDFTNPNKELHWLQLSLQGTISNKNAVGTKVVVKTKSGYLSRYYCGGGFLSQSIKPVHFGLANDTEILELKISWPSGLVDTYTNVPVDKIILAREANGYSMLVTEPVKKIHGCMMPTSCNYNQYATVSSGKCQALESASIKGNAKALFGSLESYSYPIGVTSTASWQVSGGEIMEGGASGNIKVKWGTGTSASVSVVEDNGKCVSAKVELSVSLSAVPVVDPKTKWSVARLWNEALLSAIRMDYARPTVHARNLFHTSVAMYDAWAAFDDKAETYLLGKDVHGFSSAFAGFTTTENNTVARKKAISYAAYRLLSHRFKNSPEAVETQQLFDANMSQLGYDIANVSADYSTGDPAALGNFIAQTVIEYGLVDGSNEANKYENIFYEPVNEALNLLSPQENPVNAIDPNRWQPLKFDSFIDQSGHVIPGTTPGFLGPEWGNVFPFSLKETDKVDYVRLGNTYRVYNDPGTPPYLDLNQDSKSSLAYKWGFALVSKWSSHLDPTDGVKIDISPKSLGNIDSSVFPKSYLDYSAFYDALEGGDVGKGHVINPITKQAYTEQKVLRGDYARVLAEFWADGPDSETPPGHWFTILNYVSDSPLLNKKFNGTGTVLSDLEWDIKAYFILGGAMHDCAVTAWGIKGWYDYIRPISAIRYMADKGQSSDPMLPNYNVAGIPLEPGYIEIIKEGDPLVGKDNVNLGKIKLYCWKGHSFVQNPDIDVAGVGWILSEDWWPYQRPSFVTPPFAGYISGHSTYSRAGAEIMTLLTGDAYFPGGMGEFVARKNEFLVFEEGPSEDVILQWATYRDASDQCSLSRIWGGIHPPQDDIPGRLIGEKIGKEVFDFSKLYFEGKSQNKLEDAMVMTYPNPVTTELTIATAEDSGVKTLFVYDMQGHLVFSATTADSRYTFNVESLTAGIYLLRVSGQKVHVDRLILKK